MKTSGRKRSGPDAYAPGGPEGRSDKARPHAGSAGEPHTKRGVRGRGFPKVPFAGVQEIRRKRKGEEAGTEMSKKVNLNVRVLHPGNRAEWLSVAPGSSEPYEHGLVRYVHADGKQTDERVVLLECGVQREGAFEYEDGLRIAVWPKGRSTCVVSGVVGAEGRYWSNVAT